MKSTRTELIGIINEESIYECLFIQDGADQNINWVCRIINNIGHGV